MEMRTQYKNKLIDQEKDETPHIVDESLTSLAVYFRNWHMFREDMNNIPC